jgi:hypothetical protein
MGVEVSENPCWVRSDTRRSWDKRPDWRRPGPVLRTSKKKKSVSVGVTEEREETKFGEGGERNGRHINADRLKRGEKGTKIIIDYVDGGHAGVSGDNGMEEGIASREGGSVGPHIIPYHYSVSPYCPSNPPLSQSVHLIPLLLHHPLKVGGGLRGTHDRKEALEGDQELYQLLLIRKRPLLAMWPANSGGEGEWLPCPVEV